MKSRDNNSLPGAILLAHGSTESEAESEMRELLGSLSQSQPGWLFSMAFLNQEPRLEQAVESLVKEGCVSIRILPLLVFKGRHILQDIPNQVEVLQSRHPGIVFELMPHLSRFPGFKILISNELATYTFQSNEA